MTRKINVIGLVVEDKSDFESLKTLISRITNRSNLTVLKMISNGCGRLIRKLPDHIQVLVSKGSKLIIVVHDKDKEDYDQLHARISQIISSCTSSEIIYLCIPIEEIEAWFLGDDDGIKRCFHITSKNKIKQYPEFINSPKEYLARYVESLSGGRKRYVNTIHNPMLAEICSLEAMSKKSPSFKSLSTFLTSQNF